MSMWELAAQAVVVLSIVAAAFFLLVRPQLRRQADHAAFLSSLKVGDRIVTRGGLVGKIVYMDGGTLLEVELATSIRVKAVKASIEERFEG